jgi:hypothetical protein
VRFLYRPERSDWSLKIRGKAPNFVPGRTHVAHYAGWPVAVSALRVLGETWDEMDAQEAASADPG